MVCICVLYDTVMSFRSPRTASSANMAARLATTSPLDANDTRAEHAPFSFRPANLPAKDPAEVQQHEREVFTRFFITSGAHANAYAIFTSRL